MSTASTPALNPTHEGVFYIESGLRRRRGILSLAAAVIVVAAVSIAVFAIDFGTAPNATAAVHSAAATSVEDSMRWETRITLGTALSDEQLEYSIAGIVSGGNAQIIWRSLSNLAAFGLPEVDPLTVIMVDDESYISFAGGVWEGPLPASQSQFLSAITADAMIGDLEQVTGFTMVGSEEIDGEQCHHYQAGAAPNDAIRSILLLTMGVAEVPLDTGPPGAAASALLNVWINSDNLIRRVGFGDDTNSFTAVTTFHQLDEPVEIARPIA